MPTSLLLRLSRLSAYYSAMQGSSHLLPSCKVDAFCEKVQYDNLSSSVLTVDFLASCQKLLALP